MSAFTEPSQAILDLITANWTETPFIIDNEVINDPPSEFMRVSFLFNDAQQQSLGSPRRLFRMSGVANCEILVEQNSGQGRSKQLVDILADIFRAQTINTTNGELRLYAPSLQSTLSREYATNQFYNAIVIIPFQYDERF